MTFFPRFSTRTFVLAFCLCGFVFPGKRASAEEEPGAAVEVDYKEIGKKEGLFVHGNQPFSGVTFSNYPDGTRKMEISILDGKLHGLTREWSAAGVLTASTEFVEGKRHGANTYWFEDGTLMKEQVYENDKLVSSKHFDHGKPID